MSSQSAARYDTQILQWASSQGRTLSAAEFAAHLDGRQVGAELFEQFRDTPEFGRDLAERLDPFHEAYAAGTLALIDAGGEAVVFFEAEHQRVIKLFASPNLGGHGWVLDRSSQGRWHVRGGLLGEAVLRFAWFEACFVSGLELDHIGTQGGFLTLAQPFLAGWRPYEDELEQWMEDSGWERWEPPTDQEAVLHHTWRRAPFVVTDVLPRNALVTEVDGRLRAIDFIVTQIG